MPSLMSDHQQEADVVVIKKAAQGEEYRSPKHGRTAAELFWEAVRSDGCFAVKGTFSVTWYLSFRFTTVPGPRALICKAGALIEACEAETRLLTGFRHAATMLVEIPETIAYNHLSISSNHHFYKYSTTRASLSKVC